jgi:hypothetical protein
MSNLAMRGQPGFPTNRDGSSLTRRANLPITLSSHLITANVYGGMFRLSVAVAHPPPLMEHGPDDIPHVREQGVLVVIRPVDPNLVRPDYLVVVRNRVDTGG